MSNISPADTVVQVARSGQLLRHVVVLPGHGELLHRHSDGTAAYEVLLGLDRLERHGYLKIPEEGKL